MGGRQTDGDMAMRFEAKGFKNRGRKGHKDHKGHEGGRHEDDSGFEAWDAEDIRNRNGRL